MIKAILDGRKSQTRRIVKPQPMLLNGTFEFYYGMWHGITPSGKVGLVKPFKSLYEVGEKLWVRETWRVTDFLHPSDENYGYIYKASENGKEWEKNDEGWKWKSSIHMPREAARIFLKVTNVRIERLNEISEEDCIAEGVIELTAKPYPYYNNYLFGKSNIPGFIFATKSFSTLWESIHGKNSWEINPWVWVIEFKKITCQ